MMFSFFSGLNGVFNEGLNNNCLSVIENNTETLNSLLGQGFKTVQKKNCLGSWICTGVFDQFSVGTVY